MATDPMTSEHAPLLDGDPICVCGSELSGHGFSDNHNFVSAAEYYGNTSIPTPNGTTP